MTQSHALQKRLRQALAEEDTWAAEVERHELQPGGDPEWFQHHMDLMTRRIHFAIKARWLRKRLAVAILHERYNRNMGFC